MLGGAKKKDLEAKIEALEKEKKVVADQLHTKLEELEAAGAAGDLGKREVKAKEDEVNDLRTQMATMQETIDELEGKSRFTKYKAGAIGTGAGFALGQFVGGRKRKRTRRKSKRRTKKRRSSKRKRYTRRR